MADVFISSTGVPALALDLAKHLHAKGLSVGVSPQSVSPEHVPRLERELARAVAVIVIWSPATLGSQHLKSVADYAHKKGKLVELCTADVDRTALHERIGGRNVAPAEDQAGVVASLARLGLVPDVKPATAPLAEQGAPAPPPEPPVVRGRSVEWVWVLLATAVAAGAAIMASQGPAGPAQRVPAKAAPVKGAAVAIPLQFVEGPSLRKPFVSRAHR